MTSNHHIDGGRGCGTDKGGRLAVAVAVLVMEVVVFAVANVVVVPESSLNVAMTGCR